MNEKSAEMTTTPMEPWEQHQEPGPYADTGELSGLVGKAGTPSEDGTAAPSREALVEAIKTVFDPEIPVDIYELGLIYDLEIGADGKVAIGMSLTAPACPVAGEMPKWVADAVVAVEGVGEVAVTLVWDPPWSTERMSDDARMVLDIG